MYLPNFFRCILWIVNFVAVLKCLSSASRIIYRETGNESRNNIEKRATLGRLASSELSNVPTCSKENSCKGRCTNQTEWHDRKCYCDPDCSLVFNDCCTDYIKYCKPQKTVGRPTKKYTYSCEQMLLKSNKPCKFSCKRVWVVSQCPFEWTNDPVRSKCETPKHDFQSVEDTYGLLPVSGNDNTTFRNAYCAFCNNVMNFKPWRLVGKTLLGNKHTPARFPPNFNFTEEIHFLLSHSEYITAKHPKNVTARFCKTDIIDYCPARRELDSCTHGNVMLVSYRQNVYKNIHCATCHGKTEQLKCFSIAKHTEAASVPLTVVLNHKDYLTAVEEHILIISKENELNRDNNPWLNRLYVNVWLQHPLNVENNFSFKPREFHDSLAKRLNVSYLELFDTETATDLRPQETRFSYVVYSMIVQIPRQNVVLFVQESNRKYLISRDKVSEPYSFFKVIHPGN